MQAATLLQGVVDRTDVYKAAGVSLRSLINDSVQDIESILRESRLSEIGEEAAAQEAQRAQKSDQEHLDELLVLREQRLEEYTQESLRLIREEQKAVLQAEEAKQSKELGRLRQIDQQRQKSHPNQSVSTAPASQDLEAAALDALLEESGATKKQSLTIPKGPRHDPKGLLRRPSPPHRGTSIERHRRSDRIEVNHDAYRYNRSRSRERSRARYRSRKRSPSRERSRKRDGDRDKRYSYHSPERSRSRDRHRRRREHSRRDRRGQREHSRRRRRSYSRDRYRSRRDDR